MGREVGGQIGMGNTCNSMADSCQCRQKPLQYCKVTSLQLIKINEKKNKGRECSLVRSRGEVKEVIGSTRRILGAFSRFGKGGGPLQGQDSSLGGGSQLGNGEFCLNTARSYTVLAA